MSIIDWMTDIGSVKLGVNVYHRLDDRHWEQEMGVNVHHEGDDRHWEREIGRECLS
ncbi:hypothetical protein [Virgibacillus halodenitrificans]|uniref:Uncharacterized protein n=1 Tax=Virgibacillus halodenitrificans TaxID=1482 RepID=A0ABR7VQ70_VIRHA|nr:hypothetical protein [Virgibacillus halodenitrificans]MBD1222978.1 hypothetical protein [Virgibacillus halodenitrificans]